MESTKEYTKFKNHPSNREPNKSSLERLEASIRYRNLLEYRPIQVDSKFYVLDGFHRLKVAEKLNVPIYYEVIKDAKSDDIITLNVHKNWRLPDYVNYYSKEDEPEYVKLKRFAESKKLNIVNAIQVLHNSRDHGLFESIRSGRYRFPNDADMEDINVKMLHYNHIIKILEEKCLGTKTFLTSGTFVASLIEFISRKEVDCEVFIPKLEVKLSLIRKCGLRGDYLEIFKEIYNWHNRNPLE